MVLNVALVDHFYIQFTDTTKINCLARNLSENKMGKATFLIKLRWTRHLTAQQTGIIKLVKINPYLGCFFFF